MILFAEGGCIIVICQAHMQDFAVASYLGRTVYMDPSARAIGVRRLLSSAIRRPITTISSRQSSGPTHDVHYETSFHKKGGIVKEKKPLPESADVVVIGGGSIGCSTAYHLSKLGAGKVILLEKEILTAGTTWHTAGIVHCVWSNGTIARMISQTEDVLNNSLPEETGFDSGYINTGTIFFTRNKDQLAGLERKSLISSEAGVDSRIVDVDEISRLHPLVNTKGLAGGLYSPKDGIIDPATVCTLYIKGAMKYGAEVFEHCEVKGIKTSRGVQGLEKVVAVETNQGTVKTNNVVNCAGCWSPYIAKMIGLELPQVTYRLQYVITERFDGVFHLLCSTNTGCTPKGKFTYYMSHWGIEGIESSPQLCDVDLSGYHRRQGGALLFGGYLKDPHLVRDGWVEKDFAFGLYDMDWEEFEPAIQEAISIVPSVAETGIKSTVSGPEAYTPDNLPLLGETPNIRGFFVGSGFNGSGMMMGGGAGRQLAHLVVNGEGEYDLSVCDINRFTRKIDHTQLIEACHDCFFTRYNISHPYKQYLGGRNLKITPLTEFHIKNGAYMSGIFGWEVPAFFMAGTEMPLLDYDYMGCYGNEKHEKYPYRDVLDKDATFNLNKDAHIQIIKESLACYDSAGIVDLSHLSKFSLSGQNAETVLRSVLSCDVTSIEQNSSTDALLLTGEGKIVAYVTVTKFADGSYQLTAASEHQDFVLRHINHFLIDNEIACDFRNVTDEYADIRIIGPQSSEVLNDTLGSSYREIEPLKSETLLITGCEAIITRSQSEGIKFYDVCCRMEDSKTVYGALMSSKVSPARVGLRALNSVLLETGQSSLMQTSSVGLTPQTAKLMNFCPLDGDREYVGKAALKEIVDVPKTSAFMRFTVESKSPIFPQDMIWRDGVYVGLVADAAYGSRTRKYHLNGVVKSLPNCAINEQYWEGNFTTGRSSMKVKADVMI